MPRKNVSRSASPQDDLRLIERYDEARDRSLVRLVTAISRAVIMYGTRTISHLGLSMSQAMVFGHLFKYNGCRQEDLRHIVTLDKGNITRAVQRLEELGLVKRTQDPVDRRAIRVYLTKQALKLEDELFTLVSQWDDSLVTGFTHKERAALIDLLLKVEANVQAMLGKEEGEADDGAS